MDPDHRARGHESFYRLGEFVAGPSRSTATPRSAPFPTTGGTFGICRLHDGHIVEVWVTADDFRLVQQLR